MDKKMIDLRLAKKMLIFDPRKYELSAKEIRFVASYCTNGFKQLTAYQQAGYTDKVSRKAKQARARRLLNEDRIIQAIEEYVYNALSPFRGTLEYQIYQTLQKRAFYTIDKFYHDNGHIKTLTEIRKEGNEEWLVCIDGLEESYYGREAEVRVRTYRLANRDQAIKKLWDVLQKAKLMNYKEKKIEKYEKLAKNAGFEGINDLFKKFQAEYNQEGS